jgi:hypothetical protein
MENYVTNIKDLVIQTLTNGSEIKANAESGDALSCFQMGMIHLLGINTSVDFEKASKYFGNQSLNNNPDANRLLGFIAECEGNFSQAFKNYSKASGSTGSNAKKPYYNKVFSERNNLQAYFKKLELSGTALNKIVTNVLNEYIKGGATKVEASIKIAIICNDTESCLIAAQDLFDAGDYYSAKRWLHNGNVSEGNSLYISVKKKITDSKNAQSLPNTLEIIEIDGNSFLDNADSPPSYTGIKPLCDKAASSCKKEWVSIASPMIAIIKKKVEDEEEARIKKQKEEETRIKKQKEEEARIKKQKEEEARIKKQKEEEAVRLMKLREESVRKKKKKTTKIVNIILLIIFVPWGILWLIGLIASASSTGNSVIGNIIGGSVILFGVVLLPYGIIKLLSVLIINRIFK